MADRGPNQDMMPQGKLPDDIDPTYQNASYLGTDEEDEEEVRDLGFIIEDHDDRRGTLTEGFEHLADLDTNEPLETNPGGPIPHATSLTERGPQREWFATDYHVDRADAEAQEEDFAATSMLNTDPDMNDGEDDFTTDSLEGIHGERRTTDLLGHVPGVTYGFGTSVPQDLGSGGFQIRDNPLMQPQDQAHPISGDLLSDEALGIRDVDEMGSDGELEQLADQYARAADQQRQRP